MIMPRMKKKKRSKKKKKKKPATGFEEFYAEAPMTPTEAREERSMYHPSLSFLERIELATQRFKKKRKWSPLRSRIFESYLSLGGLKSGPNRFQGLDPRDEDFEEISDLMPVISTSDMNLDDYDVDFVWVVKVFLGWGVSMSLGLSDIFDLQEAPRVVLGYLQYLEFHDVCPEYRDDLREAIKVATTAQRELIRNSVASRLLPGRFNRACTVLYLTQTEIVPEFDWIQPLDDDISKAEARDIIQLELGDPALKAGVKRSDSISVEVVAIEESEGVGLQALCKIRFVSWQAEDAPQIPSLFDGESMEVYLEKSILEHFYLGMHLEISLVELDNGFQFMENVMGIMPSFYVDHEETDLDTEF